jgi:ApaG protein
MFSYCLINLHLKYSSKIKLYLQHRILFLTVINDNIEIRTEVAFSKLQSNIELNEFFFSYHISIFNHSAFEIQLLERKWHIFDSDGENRFVEGLGVVGEQPIISSRGFYDYYSGCLLKTGIGKMHGTYTFQRTSSLSLFEIEIPEFNLVLPWLNN